MNTENTQDSENPLWDTSVLSRFFSPKTVEEQFLLEKFTPDMINEIQDFMPFFTKKDEENILSCTSPVNCLYMVANVIARIRLEQSILSEPVVENPSTLCMEEIHERFEEIFQKQ